LVRREVKPNGEDRERLYFPVKNGSEDKMKESHPQINKLPIAVKVSVEGATRKGEKELLNQRR